MRQLLVLLMFLPLLFAAAAAADGQKVYKWTDDAGVLHYSDTPPKPQEAAPDLQTMDLPDYPPQDPLKLAQLQAAWAASAAAWEQGRQMQDEQQRLAVAAYELSREQAEFEANLAAMQQVSDDETGATAYPIYVSSRFVPRVYRRNLFVARHPPGRGGPALMHITHAPPAQAMPNRT